MKLRLPLVFLITLIGILCCTDRTSSFGNGKDFLRTMFWTSSYGSSLDISWLYLGDDGILVRNPTGGVNLVDVLWEQQPLSEREMKAPFLFEHIYFFPLIFKSIVSLFILQAL